MDKKTKKNNSAVESQDREIDASDNKSQAKKLQRRAVVGDWYADRYRKVSMQRNIALLFGFVLIVSVTLMSLAVVYITSSRTIDPFVIEVDKRTGITTLVDPSQVRQYSANEAVNNYFLYNYIKSRELFDKNNYEYNWYVLVRVFSDDETFRSFLYDIRTDNPNSPQNLYRNEDKMEIKIRSIQYLNNNSVQVRFAIGRSGVDFASAGKGRGNISNRIALISFRYLSMKMDEEQRFINPLGFQITSYRVSDEFIQ